VVDIPRFTLCGSNIAFHIMFNHRSVHSVSWKGDVIIIIIIICLIQITKIHKDRHRQ